MPQHHATRPVVLIDNIACLGWQSASRVFVLLAEASPSFRQLPEHKIKQEENK